MSNVIPVWGDRRHWACLSLKQWQKKTIESNVDELDRVGRHAVGKREISDSQRKFC